MYAARIYTSIIILQDRLGRLNVEKRWGAWATYFKITGVES
jgi:hypothetical protein